MKIGIAIAVVVVSAIVAWLVVTAPWFVIICATFFLMAVYL